MIALGWRDNRERKEREREREEKSFKRRVLYISWSKAVSQYVIFSLQYQRKHWLTERMRSSLSFKTQSYYYGSLQICYD